MDFRQCLVWRPFWALQRALHGGNPKRHLPALTYVPVRDNFGQTPVSLFTFKDPACRERFCLLTTA